MVIGIGRIEVFKISEKMTTSDMIALGVGILTVLASIIIYQLQKRKKNLSYTILSNIELLTKNEKVTGKVQVLYEGHEVNNIQVLTLKLFNGGNTSIDKTDFNEDIKIEFPSPTKILSVELVSTRPKDLSVSCDDISPNGVIIFPLLLNGGDEITYKFIGDGELKDFTITGRIKDISSIKKVKEKTSLFPLTAISGLLLVSTIFSFFIFEKIK